MIERRAGDGRFALHSVVGAREQSLTFSESPKSVRRVSGTLADRGIEPQSMIGAGPSDTIHCAVVVLAALRLGATVACLREHPDPTAYRLELELVRPVLVITDAERREVIGAQTDATVLTASLDKLSRARRGSRRCTRPLPTTRR